MAAACDERGVHLWSLADDKHLGKLDVPRCQKLLFSDKGRRLTTVNAACEQAVWKTADLSAVSKIEVLGHAFPMGGNPTFLDQQQDDLGEYLAYLCSIPTIGRPGVQVVVIDMEGDGMVQLIAISNSPSVNTGALALSHNGRFLAASAGDSGKLAVRDLGKMAENKDTAAHDKAVTALAFTPGDKWLLSGDATGVVKFWLVADIKPTVNGSPWAKELCWKNLAMDMPMNAVFNLWQLVDYGDEGVAFISKRLAPAADMTRDELAKIITDLDSDTFSVRKDARDKLAPKVEANWPLLEEALADKLSTEVRTTLEELLTKVDKGNAAQEKYIVRILERVDTPSARDMLRTLAARPQDSNIGKRARAAMQKLGIPATTQSATTSSAPATSKPSS